MVSESISEQQSVEKVDLSPSTEEMMKMLRALDAKLEKQQTYVFKIAQQISKIKEPKSAKEAVAKEKAKDRIPYDEWKKLHGKTSKPAEETKDKKWLPKDKYLAMMKLLE